MTTQTRLIVFLEIELVNISRDLTTRIENEFVPSIVYFVEINQKKNIKDKTK